MKVTSVEVRRVFNMGEYENLRLGATAELEEGDEFFEALDKLHTDILAQKEAIVQAEKDEWSAMRTKTTVERGTPAPAAVLACDDLWERAAMAAKLDAETMTEASRKAASEACLAWFGIEANFETNVNGDVSATISTKHGNLTLHWVFDEFNVTVPPGNGSRQARQFYNVRSLAQLGAQLSQLSNYDF